MTVHGWLSRPVLCFLGSLSHATTATSLLGIVACGCHVSAAGGPTGAHMVSVMQTQRMDAGVWIVLMAPGSMVRVLRNRDHPPVCRLCPSVTGRTIVQSPRHRPQRLPRSLDQSTVTMNFLTIPNSVRSMRHQAKQRPFLIPLPTCLLDPHPRALQRIPPPQMLHSAAHHHPSVPVDSRLIRYQWFPSCPKQLRLWYLPPSLRSPPGRAVAIAV